MYLCKLEIENFRGIRFARMNLNETTVVTGENDSGKTTLLDAVCQVLSPSGESHGIIFTAGDFHMRSEQPEFRPSGSIGIRLTFRERRPDEWSSLRLNDYGFRLEDDQETLQELTLEVKSGVLTERGEARASWRIRTAGQTEMAFSEDMAILDWFRRLNPVFRIRSDMFSKANLDFSREPGIFEDFRTSIKYVESHSNIFRSDGIPMEDIIYDILGKKSDSNSGETRRIVLHHGSAAEKIGMLVFIEAFLESGGLKADASAEPIIIIEDPEAHLHPMTLQSVKILIERMNWQKIITTHSGSLLSDFALEDIRRITRREGNIREYRVKPGSLSSEELRRLSYHVRKMIPNATFARCWLLVEGESEMWLMPHLARLCGYDFAMEGVVCVEFAQCGIAPLVKAASQLGIEWFLMADGDAAGRAYIETARHFARQLNREPEEHCLRFREKDIENHLFFNGYADIYSQYSGIPVHDSENMQPRRIIGRAIHRNSKPFMAIAIIEAMARTGSQGVPSELRKVVEQCVRLAGGSENSR